MVLPETIFRAAFEQAIQPLIVLNDRGIPALWNAAFEKLFIDLAGFVPERLAVPLFDWLEERESFKYTYYVTEVLLGRLPMASFETGVRSASGKRLWLRTTLSQLAARPGSLVPPLSAPPLPAPPQTAMPQTAMPQAERWIWCSFNDISEQKFKEHHLVSAKEEAEKATQTKSQFLANMSHEIRTPIQTILGMSEMLGETALDTEQQDYVKTVRFSADVLLGLINDILDFSKIEAGKLEIEMADFELRPALRQAIDLIIMDAHKKGLEVILDIDEALPATVRGDPGRLRQIVVNLFKNAVKFTRDGEIVVTARAASTPENGSGSARIPADQASRSMLLTVADSGMGVSDALRARLFTPFTQGVSASATQGGTGLGLAISRHLVDAMGGAIWVEPNEPRGSRFIFTLPLYNPARAASGLAAAGGSDTGNVATGRLAASRVLVVDDHPLARAHSVRVARSFGLEVDCVPSGEEALSALRLAAESGRPYAASLIDQNMPGMDGWRLAAEVTADRRINDTRLVLLAPEGGLGSDAKMKLLQWFNGYATKPINPGELFDVMARALGDELDLASAEEPAGTARGPGMAQGSGAARGAGADDTGAGMPEEKGARLGLKILLAEDHAVNQQLFAALLEKLGCEVALASDGKEALSIAATADFDMVLMDVFMPLMDGYEATRALRARGFSKPIIAVTASALKGERDKCIEVGMNDILTKPFKKVELAAMLEFWAGTSGRKPARAAAAHPRDDGAEAGTATLDFNALVETFLGRRDKVVELLERFRDKTSLQLAELKAALAAADARTLREVAHSIKGASWSLTAKALGDLAMNVESATVSGDLAAVEALLPQLAARFAEFEAEAGRYTEGP